VALFVEAPEVTVRLDVVVFVAVGAVLLKRRVALLAENRAVPSVSGECSKLSSFSRWEDVRNCNRVLDVTRLQLAKARQRF
jgi:hypothetical protein